MKVTVNRQLKSGLYEVAFKVGDFTPEELQKMAAFGVPKIDMVYGSNPVQAIKLTLTQIRQEFNAGFPSEQAARNYETNVLEQIRAAMEFLREQKDDFSSSTEVPI